MKNNEEDKLFYFLKQLFYNDSLDENFLSETTWWFIDPLEELSGTLWTLEVETAWVLLGARCGQYQGLVAVTQETFRCNVAVARVSLLFHTLQVFRQFVHSTRYVALGCPPGCWTAVVLPITPVRCLDAAI